MDNLVRKITCSNIDISVLRNDNYKIECETDFTKPNENFTVPQDFMPNENEVQTFDEQLKEVTQQTGMDCFPTDLYYKMLARLYDNGKYRDLAMQVCQANWGMRFSDLISVRGIDIINKDGSIKDKFSLFEKKTEHTRKIKRTRQFYNNKAVKKALVLLLQHSQKRWYDFLFTSESNNAPKIEVYGIEVVKPLSHTQAENIIKNNIKAIYTDDIKLNTHSLRKMYGNVFVETGSKLMAEGKLHVDLNMLTLAQNDFGHSSMSISQRYIGQVEAVKSIVIDEMNIGLEIFE